eukprot:856877-Prymnesium_polylepis.4
MVFTQCITHTHTLRALNLKSLYSRVNRRHTLEPHRTPQPVAHCGLWRTGLRGRSFIVLAWVACLAEATRSIGVARHPVAPLRYR